MLCDVCSQMQCSDVAQCITQLAGYFCKLSASASGAFTYSRANRLWLTSHSQSLPEQAEPIRLARAVHIEQGHVPLQLQSTQV
jgi:hypothetical protein